MKCGKFTCLICYISTDFSIIIRFNSYNIVSQICITLRDVYSVTLTTEALCPRLPGNSVVVKYIHFSWMTYVNHPITHVRLVVFHGIAHC